MANIVIIGSGILGEAAGKGFAAFGHRVIFCDQNDHVLEPLRIDGWQVRTLNMLEKEEDVDFFVICTLSLNDFVKLNYFKTAIMAVGRTIQHSKKFPVVLICNNLPPGTTRKLTIPMLERHSQKKIVRDFGVCVVPRYMRSDQAYEDFQHPPLVLIGSVNKKCAECVEALYQPFHTPIIHTTIEEAEMQKYIHNLFNACKISFFNEMRQVCKKAGVDADVIFPIVVKSAEGLRDPLYGVRNLGPLTDNHLSKDVTTFLRWAKKYAGGHMPILQAMIKINQRLKRP